MLVITIPYKNNILGLENWRSRLQTCRNKVAIGYEKSRI